MIYYICLGWFAFINIFPFLLFFIDKKRAKSGGRRIPEARLMVTAALGGGLGALMSMYIFRHKTKHKLFTIGIPAIILVETALWAFLVIIFSR